MNDELAPIAMLRIKEIRLPIGHPEEALKRAVAEKLGIDPEALISFRISRQSIDARKKREAIFRVYTVEAEVRHPEAAAGRTGVEPILPAEPASFHPDPSEERQFSLRPVIAGCGPAGLFAALTLSRRGHPPLLIERGREIGKRIRDVRRFTETGVLDPESNILFGEGGAGTFSDGKLTTNLRGERCRKVLETLAAAGAPADILYKHKPSIGTDLLRKVVRNLRREILSLGGEIRFERTMTGIIVKDGRLAGVEVGPGEVVPTRHLVLAIGHSARDTFEMLHARGIILQRKPFSIGLRVEHPQKLIDRIQYGEFAGHSDLEPADYRMAAHLPGGRSVYTFCMCPGGWVVPSASEPGGVVTNGMSEHARDGEYANSALLVGVDPSDFGGSHPLSGVEFQRRWEREAFRIGGGDFRAPVQRLSDFLKGAPSQALGEVRPTYRPGFRLADLSGCLPRFSVDALRAGIREFDRKMPGFALPDAVLTGVETRSSSPVRIERGETLESSIRGLYPAGEGSGYAGGIMSAAVDGIRAAEAVLRSER